MLKNSLRNTMKKGLQPVALGLVCALGLFSCDTQESLNPESTGVSEAVLAKISQAGFDANNVIASGNGGYIVENDIYLTEEALDNLSTGEAIPGVEHYSTNNVVAGPRMISIYMPTGKKSAFDDTTEAGLEKAINRYNAEGLELTFQRVAKKNTADIVIKKLSPKDVRSGVLGAAGFPTDDGEPFDLLFLNDKLVENYGASVDVIASLIAHEIGHCIGFRHTDYFDRSISCGGDAFDEGDAGFGANHIPGTPTDAKASKNSWMLSCNIGSSIDRPFTKDD